MGEVLLDLRRLPVPGSLKAGGTGLKIQSKTVVSFSTMKGLCPGELTEFFVLVICNILGTVILVHAVTFW